MMSNISMVEAKLQPGFRFHPRDDELVCDYLINKIHNSHHQDDFFIEVDLNKSEPWDIPESACVGGKQWYFYSQRDKKYATGLRTNRATATGYWKATGKDKPILRKGTLVGMRKTLVFYQGRAPKGRKSNWVMHEFRFQLPYPLLVVTEPSSHKEDWVLCRVFHKNKEIAPKPSIETCSNDTIRSNSNLPPLIDSSFIAFDQNTPNLSQQVPCFSSFTSISSQNINPIFTQVPYNSNIMITKHSEAASMIGHVSSSSSTARLDRSSIDCEEKSSVIDVVLNHLKKIENGNFDDTVKTSLSSSESYLSEVGMPNIWSNYYN